MNDDTTLVLPDIKLRFNIQHPHLEECYAFGYECGAEGISEEENPFKQGSTESEQWLDGWWAGFYEESPLLKLESIDEPAKTAELASNDHHYYAGHPFIRFLEISGILVVSALVSYQLIELVAAA